MRYGATIKSVCRRVAAVTVGLMIHVVQDYAQLPYGSVQLQYEDPQRPRRIKVNNGWVIAIRGERVDRSMQGVVEAFDRTGNKMCSINPLSHFRTAKWFTVVDAAVGTSGLVAVAGYSLDDQQMAPMLLVYSPQGQLLHALNMPTERAILRLALDETDHIWTLGYGDSTASHFIFRYSLNGERQAELLPRLELLRDSSFDPTLEGPDLGGQLSFGVNKAEVWAWFPADRLLVRVDRDTGRVERRNTGLPTAPKTLGSALARQEVTVSKWLPESGELVAQVVFFTSTGADKGLFSWSSKTNEWRQVQVGQIKGRGPNLVNIDQGRLITALYPTSVQPLLQIGSADFSLR
jgi:hypothetical protein